MLICSGLFMCHSMTWLLGPMLLTHSCPEVETTVGKVKKKKKAVLLFDLVRMGENAWHLSRG